MAQGESRHAHFPDTARCHCIRDAAPPQALQYRGVADAVVGLREVCLADKQVGGPHRGPFQHEPRHRRRFAALGSTPETNHPPIVIRIRVRTKVEQLPNIHKAFCCTTCSRHATSASANRIDLSSFGTSRSPPPQGLSAGPISVARPAFVFARRIAVAARPPALHVVGAAPSVRVSVVFCFAESVSIVSSTLSWCGVVFWSIVHVSCSSSSSVVVAHLVVLCASSSFIADVSACVVRARACVRVRAWMRCRGVVVVVVCCVVVLVSYHPRGWQAHMLSGPCCAHAWCGC